MDEKVSVVIPVYNAKKTIRRCIESIICQTYKNLEIIIVYDDSGDCFTDEIEEYLEHIHIISFVEEKRVITCGFYQIGH